MRRKYNLDKPGAATGAGRLGSGIGGPKKRGRPFGSTNKRKQLQQDGKKDSKGGEGVGGHGHHHPADWPPMLQVDAGTSTLTYSGLPMPARAPGQAVGGLSYMAPPHPQQHHTFPPGFHGADPLAGMMHQHQQHHNATHPHHVPFPHHQHPGFPHHSPLYAHAAHPPFFLPPGAAASPMHAHGHGFPHHYPHLPHLPPKPGAAGGLEHDALAGLVNLGANQPQPPHGASALGPYGMQQPPPPQPPPQHHPPASSASAPGASGPGPFYGGGSEYGASLARVL